MKNLLLSASLVFTLIIVLAHHNVTKIYDPQRLIDVEGVVTETLWRNPHIQISLRVTDENGEQEVWNTATEALSNLRRWKIDWPIWESRRAHRISTSRTMRTR